MSGLAGLLHLDGKPVDPAEMERMIAAMRHRAPAGVQLQCRGSFAVAALRGPARDHGGVYPIDRTDDCEATLLVADARWDNLPDLARQLDPAYPETRPADAAHLLIEAYRRWGPVCADRLIGDFAFATHNPKTNALFCARDPLGIKPLYFAYSPTPAAFAFASEIRPLLTLPWVDAGLNESRIADYLLVRFRDMGATFYRGVQRLPPGHSLTVDEAGLRLVAYWRLDPTRKLHLTDDREYAQAFRQLFVEAVRCRADGDGPLGCLLSGGLDSTSIVGALHGLLKERPDRPLVTLSATFPGHPEADEHSQIAAVAKSFGVENVSVSADRLSPLGLIEQFYDVLDEPFHVPNLYVYWSLAEAARARGLCLALDGVDGDTIVGHGLDWLAELFRSGRWIRLLSEVLWLRRRFRRSAGRFLLHHAVLPTLGRWLPPGRSGDAAARAALAVVRPDFARRTAMRERQRDEAAAAPGGGRTVRENHRRQIESGIVQYYLDVNDRTAAAFGLDQRHPFYDRRLVEFCLALPPEQRLSRGWDRVIQRRAVEGLVPAGVQWRINKGYWGDFFKRRLLEADRPRLETVLQFEPQWIADYCDPTALRACLGRVDQGQGSETDWMNLWLAATLGHWLRGRRRNP